MDTMTAAMTVEVKESDAIQVKQHCEYAAWYTLWKVLPGTYELKREMGKTWPYTDKPIYYAEVDAEIVEDYYAAHFGGVPVTQYDIHQNAGKRGKVFLNFNPAELLKHEAVEIPEEEYERILTEAMNLMWERAKIDMACINDNYIGKLEWVGGHAKSLVQHAELYAEFYYTMGRREYNRKCEAEGRTGWTDPRETHAKKDVRTWNGSKY